MANYDLDFGNFLPVEVPVTGPDKVQYFLREASGTAAAKYRNACMACMKMNADGKTTGIVGMADVEPLLISLCLWDESNRNPTAAYVATWPAKVLKRLFTAAQDISDLKDVPKERGLLSEALESDNAPCTLDQLRSFVNGLSDVKYAPLKKWLEPTTEELAKNEQSGTPSGSI